MHVLVTGAGGFSGAEIAGTLVRHGHRVTACFGSTRGRLPPDTAVSGEIYGDLASGLPLPDRIDAIVHAAARSPAPGVSAEDMMQSNVAATRRLVRWAKQAGAHTFIYLSSLSVHGRIESPVVDENTPVAEPEAYGISKRLGEELVAAESGWLRSLSIRLPGVIGRRSVRNWLTGVLEGARNGSDIPVFNPDAHFNNAVHVADLAVFVTALLSDEWHGHDALPIAAAGHTTVLGAVQILVDAFGRKSQIRIEEASRKSFVISNARACDRYRYHPMEITQMLKRFAAENRN